MIIEYEGSSYEVSDEYSFKDFTGHDLSLREDMDGIVIYSSCFSHEIPDAETLPIKLSGTTFIKCNLSNIKVPAGNTVLDCITTRFKVQNDLRDWEIDNNNEPIKILNEKYWVQQGFSVDAKDIPQEKISSLEEIKKV